MPNVEPAPGLQAGEHTTMEPDTETPEDDSLPPSALVGKRYSNMNVHDQSRAHFGDAHYHGGQHTHNYSESPPCGAVRVELTGHSTSRDAEDCGVH
jgi:hypothetical protein